MLEIESGHMIKEEVAVLEDITTSKSINIAVVMPFVGVDMDMTMKTIKDVLTKDEGVTKFIAVANGCTENQFRELFNYVHIDFFDKVNVIYHQENKGISVAWNEGIRDIRNFNQFQIDQDGIRKESFIDVIAIVNDDIFLQKNCLTRCAEYMKVSDLFVVSPTVLDQNSHDVFKNIEHESDHVYSHEDLNGMIGSCFLIDVDQLNKFEPKSHDVFDETYFCMWEDCDFVYRATQWRSKCVKISGSCVHYHLGTKTIEKIKNRSDHYQNGMKRFIEKHNVPPFSSFNVHNSIAYFYNDKKEEIFKSYIEE